MKAADEERKKQEQARAKQEQQERREERMRKAAEAKEIRRLAMEEKKREKEKMMEQKKQLKQALVAKQVSGHCWPTLSVAFVLMWSNLFWEQMKQQMDAAAAGPKHGGLAKWSDAKKHKLCNVLFRWGAPFPQW